MSVLPTATNSLRIVKIQGIKQESPTVKTFSFHDKLCAKAKPGQFVMVWIPGVDEVPMSLSAMRPDGYSSITVAEVGEATKALHRKKIGDVLGIRGPYGNCFTLVGGNVMVVGGGTGLAPLASLVESLVGLHAKITFVLGAKTRDELLFLKRIETTLSRADGKVIATTEDGSYGVKGLATDPVEKILAKKRFNMIYTCGPEKMMQKMFLLAEQRHRPLQASLERFMRCAMGLCGSCVIGKFRVCKDGPIFSNEQLREVRNEFARFTRRADGRRISL